MKFHSLPLAILFLTISSWPVSACAETSNLSALELWEKGRIQVQRGAESGNKSTLEKAERLLKAARSQMPDNVNLQVEYYRLLYHLVGEKIFNRAALEKEFSLLHPKAKEVIHSPAMLDVLDAFQRDGPSLFTEPATPEEKLRLLKLAIKQQPKSTLAWYLLSVHQQKEKHDLLALDAALMALELEEENVSALYQAGELYTVIAERNGSVYEETEILGKAAKHLAKAVVKAPNHRRNTYSLNLLGQTYIRLGLFPLALEVSKKAKRWMVYDGVLLHPVALTDALIYLGKGDDAVELMSKSQEVDVEFFSQPLMINAAKTPQSRSRFAAANILKGNWKRAYTEYVKIVKKSDSPRLKWIGQWVHHVYGNKSPRFVKMMKMEEAFEPISEKSVSDWIKKINAYLTDTNSDEMTLVKASSGIFQQVDAHFYTALNLWLNGDPEGSIRHLNEAVKFKVYGYREHVWATVFLKSDLFSENKG